MSTVQTIYSGKIKLKIGQLKVKHGRFILGLPCLSLQYFVGQQYAFSFFWLFVLKRALVAQKDPT